MTLVEKLMKSEYGLDEFSLTEMLASQFDKNYCDNV